MESRRNISENWYVSAHVSAPKRKGSKWEIVSRSACGSCASEGCVLACVCVCVRARACACVYVCVGVGAEWMGVKSRKDLSS